MDSAGFVISWLVKVIKMTTRDTRRAFLRLLDQTWPGVQSEFVAAMRQARAGVDMKALEAAIARGDVDAAFRALRFDAADMFRTDTAITAALAAGGNYQMGAFQHATRRAPIASRVVQSFGGRNERAERIARDLGARLVTEVLDDTRVMIAQTIRGGLEAGEGRCAPLWTLAGAWSTASDKAVWWAAQHAGGVCPINAGRAVAHKRCWGSPDRDGPAHRKAARDQRLLDWPGWQAEKHIYCAQQAIRRCHFPRHS